MSERFAIYLAPEEGTALARFGQTWFAAPEHADLTAEARIYGFHATMKPPFRLREGMEERELRRRLANFAQAHAGFTLAPCVPSHRSGFVALRPEEDERLLRLAEECVREFDDFRAPMTEAERKKRIAAGLSERQIGHLDRWGYPHVMEDFHPHFTLTCRVSSTEATRLGALIPRDVLSEPFAVHSLCLFHQHEAGAHFVLTDRFALSGGL
jgi:hypothetical protein